MKTIIFRLRRLGLLLIVVVLFAQPVVGKSGQEIVNAMVSAHGGIEKWRSAPTVSFEDRFLAVGAQKAEISQVTVSILLLMRLFYLPAQNLHHQTF